MKKVFLTTTLAVGVLFAAASAKAEENYVEKFHCTNEQGQSLVVSELVDSQAIVDSEVVLSHGDSQTKFFGSHTVDLSDPYFKTWNYALTFFGTKKFALLKIIVKSTVMPQFCGRAGCPETPPATPLHEAAQAVLTIDQNEISFNCQ